MIYKQERERAIETAFAAGDAIMRVYEQSFSVHYKKDASPLTDADISANALIVENMRKYFPEDGLVSEESEDDQSRLKSKRFWVVDPLDGTKEFVKHNGEFVVSIGLVEAGEVVLGVIYVPVKRKVYYAEKGGGAFVLTRDSGKAESIRVSERKDRLRLLISRSHPTNRTLSLIAENHSQIETIVEMGSALKGCMIAEGTFEAYYNFGRSMKWDTCAMDCIVREAGGILRRLDGKPIDYTEADLSNRGFFILNQKENCLQIPKPIKKA
jgi:3'(2'), 5'-bisphosphate nucleotidase